MKVLIDVPNWLYNAMLEHREPIYSQSLGEAVRDGIPLNSLEKPNKWIPVSERLPEDKQSVLVWCPQYKNIYCAYLEKEQWWIFGAFVQIVPNEVVAWMPLPLPWKGE